MTHEHQVLVTLQFDSEVAFQREAREKACVQAISNVVHMGEAAGFCHDLAHNASIGVVDIETFLLQTFHAPRAKWVDHGYQHEDGSLIEFPDEDGSIRYRDQHGNHEATWTPGTEEHEKHLEIFTGENSPWTVWKGQSF